MRQALSLLLSNFLVLGGCGTEVGNGRAGVAPQPKVNPSDIQGPGEIAANDKNEFQSALPFDPIMAHCSGMFTQTLESPFSMTDGSVTFSAARKDGYWTVTSSNGFFYKISSQQTTRSDQNGVTTTIEGTCQTDSSQTFAAQLSYSGQTYLLTWTVLQNKLQTITLTDPTTKTANNWRRSP